MEFAELCMEENQQNIQRYRRNNVLTLRLLGVFVVIKRVLKIWEFN